MKKIIAFCVMLMMSSVTFANNDAPSSAVGVAVTKTGSVFKLYYKNTKHNDVSVSILNAKKQIIYKEIIQDVDGFIRPYNLNALKDGEYTIEVVTADKRHVEMVKK